MAASTASPKPEAQMTELFDAAVKAFGDTLKAGVQVQEDVVKWWADALAGDGVAHVQDWQTRGRSAMAEALPAAQKNAEQWLKLLEQNYRRSMELFRKAAQVDAGSNPAEARDKAQQLWQASLDLARDNVQAMTEANVKMLELWSDLLHKAEAGATKAAAKAARSKQ